MKKLFEQLFGKFNLGTILLGLIIALISINGALATSITAPYHGSYYPNYNNMQNSQYYSVLFDGEGDAKVVAKFIVFNNNPSNANSMNLMNGVKIEIPGQDIRIINVFSLDNGLEFLDYKTERLSNSVILNVNFKNSIKSLQSTTFLVSYKSNGYAGKSKGLFGTIFNYNFETAKLDRDIDYTSVGVSVNSGLFMEEVKSNVNYLSNSAFDMIGSAEMTKASFDTVSRYTNNIGYGQKIKTANNLDPYESFSVSGKYSDSEIELEKGKYIWMFIFGLIGLFVLVFSFFRARRWIVSSKDEIRKVIASGFLFTLLLSVLWILFFLFMNFMSRYYNLWIFIMVIFILLIIVSVILLLGPCIYFAVKYKPIFVVWYLAGFFVSLLVFALVAIVGYFVLFYKPISYGYYY